MYTYMFLIIILWRSNPSGYIDIFISMFILLRQDVYLRTETIKVG